MLLDYRRKEHIPLMNRYKKVRGINLINQYLPHLNPLEQMYVIDSEEDWAKIEQEFPIDKVTARCDCPLGVNGKLPDGQTFHRDNVRGYIRDVKSAVADGVVILQQMKKGYNERLHTQGGVNLDVVMGEAIRMEYVGPSFDCRELCKGKASHEAWCIPWDEVPFLKESSIGKYKMGEISQVGYKASAEERCSFLMGTFLKEYLMEKHKIDNMQQVDHELSPEEKQALFEAYVAKKKEILAVMPDSYKGVKRQILRDVIAQVIFPLYDQRETLARNGLKHFGVEMNVVEDGTLVPLELSVGDRFIQKDREKKTLLSKLTEER